MATASASTDFGTKAQNFYLQQANFLDPGSDDISVCSWCYLNATEVDLTLIGQLDGTGTGRTYLSTGVSVANILSSFLGGSQINNNTTISATTWIFVCFTCAAGASQTATFYLNGQADGTHTITMEAATGAHRLGAHKVLTNINWNGLIGTSQVYNAVLSSEKINELLHNPFSIPENQQWFPDLQSNSTYRDLSPQQRGDPSVTGSLSASTDGPPVGMLYQGMCQ